MKKTFLISILLCLVHSIQSQSLSFLDLGVLFSEEDYNGSARYNSMSGAFGALGGDLSSIYQNPAGGAVFSRSEISTTYSNTTLHTDAIYYGNTNYNKNRSSRFPQFGMVFVFDSFYRNSDWKKFSLSFNYSILSDFESEYTSNGNNGDYARYNINPLDDTFQPYNTPNNQTFNNYTNGKHDVYNFSFASEYKDIFYLGSSLNFHNIEFLQETELTESNRDENGNTMAANYSQFITEYGEGISLGIGIIVKPSKSIRLGFAYQSPIWFGEIIEESNAIDYDTNNSYTGFEEQGYLDIESNDLPGRYENTNSQYPEILVSRYTLNTPEKWTASAAVTFGQYGILSVDYHAKNNSILAVSQGIRAGGELRLKRISLRGGAFFEESPYSNNEEKIYKKGLSAGLGFKFKFTKIDFAYQHTVKNDNYFIYDASESIENISLRNNFKRITATISCNF